MVAYARVVAETKGRRAGRPVSVDAHRLAWGERLRADGDTIAEIVTETGLPRSTHYRHLPARPSEQLTA